MRVPLSWLKDWVDVPWDADELAERLTAAGLEVEAVERPGEEVKGVIMARLVSIAPHPQADRLWVAQVETGSGIATVVTGAPNVSEAQPGTWVVYAPPGAVIGGGIVIGTREFKGINSEGMLCSAGELGLPEDGEPVGLLLLPPGEVERPGISAAGVLGLGDPVLVFDLTPNFAAHCQSIVGIAREVAAITGQRIKVPPLPDAAVDDQPASGATSVEILDPDGCTCYIARIIDGVKVGPSPFWLRRRLQLAGMRSINNVVDVTNYVMLETGQPLHGFDYHRLAEGRIIVRRARPGEAIETLDGQERPLTTADLVIADAQAPVALAGIMGGAASEVTDGTQRVLLEAAHFSPIGILRTSRRLGLRTEASMRFEKGLDPLAPEEASHRAAVLIAALAQGRLLQGRVAAQAVEYRPRTIPVRPDFINGLLGTDLTGDQIVDYLTRYGFEVSGGTARVPSWRTDVHGEADLAEEVARLHGYDQIPAVPPPGIGTGTGRPETERLVLQIKRKITGCGFTEISTFSFAPADLADKLRLPEGHPQRQAIKIANPMNEEQAALRTTLLGGAVTTIHNNARHRIKDMALFEIGTIYLPRAGAAGQDGDGALPGEHQHLLLAACGDVRRVHWQDQSETADVFFIKGVLEELSRFLRRDLRAEGAVLPFLHPGRGAILYGGDEELGYLGELHPELCRDLELPGRVVVAELDLTRWLAQPAQAMELRPIPRFPAVERDVAFELDSSVPAAAAEELIRREAGQWLESVTLFDVYRGQQVAEGYRSLAYSLVYRAGDRTLTDEEVDAVHLRVREALARDLGATLR